MTAFNEIAPAFVEMAHEIVWCAAATADVKGRPRSRVLHPIWQWGGERLTGWIMTGATPIKLAHLEASPHLSCNYWAPSQDTCLGECRAGWANDIETKQRVWDLFLNGPAPVGYNPSIIPGWDSPGSPGFAVLKLDPWRLRVMPAAVMMEGKADLLQSWWE